MSTFGCVLWCILVGTPIVGSLALRLYDRYQKRAELRRTARLIQARDRYQAIERRIQRSLETK